MQQTVATTSFLLINKIFPDIVFIALCDHYYVGIIAQDQEKQESVQDIEIYVNGMNSTDLLLIRSDLVS